MSNDLDVRVIQKTQKILGKYIKKPPLTDKLLRKPPFRFLHDVVNSVIKETTFLKGLYTERELVSENVNDKDEKIAFLNKLIDATKSITGIELNVRSSKVIAGLEPAETNLLLQAIGTALNKKLDSSQYVAQFKSDKKIKSQTSVQGSDKKIKQDKNKDSIANKGEKKKKSSIPTATNTTLKASDKDGKSPSSKDSMGSSRNEAKGKGKIKKMKEKTGTPKDNTSDVTQRKSVSEMVSGTQELINETTDDKESNRGNLDDVNTPEEKEIKAIKNVLQQQEDLDNNTKLNAAFESDTEKHFEESVIKQMTVENENLSKNPEIKKRIKSAKLRDPILTRNNEVTVGAFEAIAADRQTFAKQRTSNTDCDNDTSTHLAPELLDSNFEKPAVRPRSSLRPPTVRPSSARPGAPRLKNDTTLPEGEMIPLGKVNVIVESYNNKEEDEEETVTMQVATEPEYQAPILQLPSDKGHLVEQILEQIHHDDIMEHVKSTVNIEWEQDAGFRNKNTANREIEQLKSAIQTLTRTANPLGKLVNYLHEDIEAMHSELDMWINSARQILVDVANQNRISNESNKPLQAQLEEIEDNIVKHQQQIITVHGNILHNEQRIQDLLMK